MGFLLADHDRDGAPGPLGGCGRRAAGGGRIKTFATTTVTLLQRRRWLTEQRVLSSGGGNRRFLQAGLPLLEDEVEVQLLNAAHLRNVPGRKTDLPDSAWIARLVEHDLARASFGPPLPIRRLRDLTRYRAALTGNGPERSSGSREKEWIEKLLEDARNSLPVFVRTVPGCPVARRCL